ncbi:MAG: lysophospholipid acyltransferase family protein [Prevotella sp.]|nr:lysophospholipid acyltransferase family protein [Prevotella sp.]
MQKIVYYIVYAFWYLLSLLPFWVHYIFSDLLYPLVYYVIRYRRPIVRKNIEGSFPEKSEKELRSIERQFYHFFCDYVVESVKFMTISKKQMCRRMKFRNMAEINKYIDSGRSCAIYLGHYCNWEWVTSLTYWLSSKGLCGELYRPLENPVFDRLFLHMRQRSGSVCIPMNESLRRLATYRREGQTLAIGYISDQVPNWSNIHLWTTFMNHEETPVFTGTERIVKSLDHPVFYLDMHRERRGHYVGEFKLMTDHPKDTEEFALTKQYLSLLETTIRRQPAFWLWSHNRWKRTREEFDRRYYYDENGKVIRRHEPKA